MTSTAGRRDRLRARLHEAGVSGALVTRLVNVRYLSGFTGSNAALLVAADGDDRLATDGRYTEQAAAESPDLRVVVAGTALLALVESVGGRRSARLAFEAHDVTVEAHDAWLPQPVAEVELVRLGHVVEDLRRVKDDDELGLLREACASGTGRWPSCCPWLRPGWTEREVARRLEDLMLDHGGDGLAFDTIVATGPNSSIPHHQPTDRPLAAGDLLKLDFGALYRRLPRRHDPDAGARGEPADWQRETSTTSWRRSQAAGRAAVVVGADGAGVDRALAIGGRGRRAGGAVPARAGPRRRARDPRGAAPGRLEHGYPGRRHPGHRRAGVYLPGRGGVRIEDTLVVTAREPELLTTTTKELLVVG